jgi:hypothetical protein
MFCFFVSNSLLALSSLKFLSSVATHSKTSKSCFYMCTLPIEILRHATQQIPLPQVIRFLWTQVESPSTNNG